MTRRAVYDLKSPTCFAKSSAEAMKWTWFSRTM